ncbi:MAG TPA: glycosyltransferase family 4 protein [Longimicrobiaceae bacterium]|nr:glycosyltransferase family 4 protein [Longimicrobiaceae bacterium]
MSRPLRLLTLGHSYVVGTNRLLADAMAAEGAGEWEVTAVAPAAFPGDLGPLHAAPLHGERCGLRTVPVHFPRPIHAMLYGRALRRVLAEGWDVVHCWEEPYVAAAAQVARWTPAGAALVFASFQNLPKRYPPPFRWLERYAMRRADGWIAFGKTVRETLAGRPEYAPVPHAVIPPGVDTGRFRRDACAGAAVLRSLGWEVDGVPVIGYLGRFVEAKGLRVMMRALDALDRPWRALFAGGGTMEGELRAWAAGRDHVRVATGVGHAAVPGWLSAMDVLCAPSLTTAAWREQFGRMLVEAFACGVVVVASDSGEIPHVVGDAGLLVAEGDPAALAAVLGALIANPGRRSELAAAGLRRAETEFSTTVAARRHLAFFRDVLRARAHRGTETSGR